MSTARLLPGGPLLHWSKLSLGGVGVQGQGKGQRLMSIFAVIDYIWLATCQIKSTLFEQAQAMGTNKAKIKIFLCPSESQ